MKKLNFTFLFTMLMSMVGLNASAHNIEVKNADGKTIYYSYINYGTELAVTYRGTDYSHFPNEYTGNVVIPESVTYNNKTYSVTSIDSGAFYDCSGLTSIEIPNSVTSIGYRAFYGCTGLTSVTIPNSVTSIGQDAFAHCSGLTSVTIGNSVTSIGSQAFRDCSGLTSIEIPNSVTSIGGSAFDGCSGLTSIEIPNSVTSIGENAFDGCSGLTSVTIPNNVTSIGGYTFSGCSGLTSVTIPNNVTSIGYRAFYGCTGLTSVTIPNSVTSIGQDAFSGTAWDNNLPDGIVYAGKVAYKYKGTMPENTSITIKNGTCGIAGGAFRDCSGLTSVTIPNSVTNIGNYAFSGCSGLTSVTLHCNSVGTWFRFMSSIKEVWIEKEVTSIGEESFAGCSGLQSIYNNAEDAFFIPKNTFDDATYSSAKLYVPTGMKATYEDTPWWLSFNKMEEYDFPTGITIPQQSKDVKVVDAYQINGLKTGSMQKGLNIIRMSDGTTRKIVSK